MEYLVITVYSISLLLIFLFSIGQVHLTWLYLRSQKNTTDKESVQIDGDLPPVTVQLPIYNEKYVVERLIEAVMGLKYPKDKLEIQILDDSTDDTSSIIVKRIQPYLENGYQIHHITRDNRLGYKAGALQYGLDQAQGEYLAVFDADFMPDSEFLLKTVGLFQDPNVGMVQTRWGHINGEYSILTKLQAFGLDAHFTVEQSGRQFAGSFINFNGTAGIWRKTCIVDAGGWSSETLTEDLDLSYRAQINGWNFKYLENLVTPAELPVVMPAIKTQQFRWNKGAAETAVKNLGKVLDMPIGMTSKIHAIFHLLNSSVYIPLLIAGLLSIPMLYIKQRNPGIEALFDIGSIFLAGFFGIAFFYWISSRQLHKPFALGYYFKRFPMFLSISMGMSLHNAVAVFEGLFGLKTPFIRTPKFNIVTKNDSWKKNSYLARKWSLSTFLEGILGVYFLLGICYGLWIGDWGLLVFHVFLSVGFLTVFFYSVLPFRYVRSGS